MLDRFEVSAKEGYFIRDLDTDTVICPEGNLLRKKCVKSNGYNTRYCCKAACHRCKSLKRCYRGKNRHKEIDFPEGVVFVKCRNWDKILTQ